jgi:large conductance mechanosensitive channel
MLKEFKEFATRGSVMDLAIGVIIGGAFGKVVSSMVNDILMPVVGLLLGRVDFSNLFVTLGDGAFATIADAKKAGVATLNYGLFLNGVMEFLIITLAIFLVIKQVNRLRAPAPAAAPTTKDCPFCKSAIALDATRCPHCTSQLLDGPRLEA